MNRIKTSLMLPFSLTIGLVIVISGCLDEGDTSDDDTLDLNVMIFSDDDVVLLKVMNGSVDWAGKEIQVENYRLTTSIITSNEGEEAEFVDLTGKWDPEEGMTYQVKIIDVSSKEILWQDNIVAEDNGGEVETFNVRGSIDGSSDQLTIEVIQEHIEWSNYKILVDGKELETEAITSEAGDSVVFSDPDSIWDAEIGNDYTVKVVNISENVVVWEDNIITTAA